MDEGFDARAVAVFKQIQNLDPQCYAAYVRLAELYQRMGLTSEAIQALQTAADGYHREGKKREALELLRKMATLDPSNTTSRIKVADLLRQEELLDEAIAEYEEAHAELVRQGESEAASNVLERILEIEPKRVPALLELAGNLLKRGFAERAEPFAKRALECEPDEVAHYELLADVYRAQQRDAELAATYRSLAEIYRRRGDEDRARDILQRFVPPNGLEAPLDADAMLGGEASLGGESALGDDASTLLDEEFLDDELLNDELLEEKDPAEPVVLQDLAEETVFEVPGVSDPGPPTDEIPIPRQLDQELEPAGPEITGDPEQLLAEASVYLRYGKRVQAFENLEAILAAEPEHRGALEKLGEAHADAGDSAAAVAAWLRVAESARRAGDDEGLVVLRDRIAALDEEAAASLGIGAAEPEKEVEEFLELPDPGDEIALGTEAPEIEEPPADEPEIEFEDEIEIDIDAGEIDADEIEGDGASQTATKMEIGPSEEATATPNSSELSASTSVSQQVGEDLEEAEFYRQQGLFEEAEAIYERVLQIVPNHPLALVRMGEIAAERGDDPGSTATGPTPPPEAPKPQQEGQEPASGEDIGHDLAEWTDSELSDTDVEVTEAADEELVEPSSDAGISQQLEASAEADFVPGESVGDVALEADVAQAVEIEVPIDDESDTGPLAEAAVGESIAVDVLPDAHEGATGAGEDALAADGADEDDTEDVVAVGEEVAAVAAEDLLAADGADEDDTEDVVAVDEGLAASFDLAAELSAAFDEDDGSSSGSLGAGTEDDGFAAVFREFKKGVSQTIDEADHETHYDLGIAYREMGLLDDAIGEFQLAKGSPSRRVDSLHMLGICSHELDRAEEAVVHLQTALEVAGVTDTQVMAIRFEQGLALESIGEIDRAREAWELVAAGDPSFCEVERRLAALEDAKPEPEPEPEPEPDAGFESFTDLFDEEEEAEEAGEDTASGPVEAKEPSEDLIADANEVRVEDDEDDTGFAAPSDTASAAQVPAAPQPQPEPPRRRRKKKISFV
ncbi:MAG: tetratricopeptide repeat protein [Deltaproteobacteria bacterium]|nr:tetratricopeptide repeat protein [Deltaproteobacteria bacterium]